MVNIFVYGTLLFSRIVKGLTGKEFITKDAILNNYKRYKIFDVDEPRRYPAIIPSEGDKVVGKVLFDVDDRSLDILDFFEGREYDKFEAKAIVENEEVEVFIYVAKPNLKPKLRDEWSVDEFERLYLEDYMVEKIPSVVQEYKGENSN